MYSAFYSNSRATTENGIQVGQILPSLGAFSQAPASTLIRDGSPDSLDPGQRVAMAARAGGGVYVAYNVGYPSVSTVRLLQVGTSNTMDVPGSAGARAVSLAAGPDGRLWVTWIAGTKVKAVHTNAAATRFGAVGTWGAPRGASTLWHSAAIGGGGQPQRGHHRDHPVGDQRLAHPDDPHAEREGRSGEQPGGVVR